MPHILFGLLALLFLSGPAIGENSDFRRCLLAAKVSPITINTSVTSSSRTLSQSLVSSGIARPAETAAHHIVAGGAQAVAPARAVLQRFGINVDEALNGVFLPANRASANVTGAAVHSTVHTAKYYDAVNEALSQASTRKEAIEVLDELRKRLQNGGL